MIAIESFKRFKLRDIITILVLAAIWLLISTIIDKLLHPQLTYIISLLIATIFMSFTVHLIRKAGSATIFYGIGGLLTQQLPNLGPLGMQKIYTLILAGIIFEIVFVIFKLEIESIQLDILLGTAISSATIPFTTALLLSTSVASTMLTALINMALVSFLVGIIGAVISFLIWYQLKTSKFVLQYEYGI